MAVVTLRAFAAMRELVGPTQQREATDIASLLDDLTDQLGAEFSRRLAHCTVVVDHHTVSPDDTSPLRDGAEVVLLPPFAGG